MFPFHCFRRDLLSSLERRYYGFPQNQIAASYRGGTREDTSNAFHRFYSIPLCSRAFLIVAIVEKEA